MTLRRIALGIATGLVIAVVGITIYSTVPAVDGRDVILQEPTPNQHETPIQSVNGKVVAISKSDMTVEVEADGKSDPLDFVVDENTKMDGDIKPGMMATVDYQTKDDKKYATHIMPAEAKKP